MKVTLLEKGILIDDLDRLKVELKESIAQRDEITDKNHLI